MRFKAVKVGYLIIMLLVVVRLFYWQILQSDNLVARAQGQRLDSTTVQATRGKLIHQ